MHETASGPCDIDSVGLPREKLITFLSHICRLQSWHRQPCSIRYGTTECPISARHCLLRAGAPMISQLLLSSFSALPKYSVSGKYILLFYTKLEGRSIIRVCVSASQPLNSTVRNDNSGRFAGYSKLSFSNRIETFHSPSISSENGLLKQGGA